MDRALLLGARGLRAFGFGFSAVLIGVYLERRGLSPALIGLTLGIGLGAASLSGLASASLAARFGRRRTLSLAGLLMALTGLDLELAGLTGMLGAASIDLGPFASVEQAVLAEATPAMGRSIAFGRYSLTGGLFNAAGGLAAGAATGASGGRNFFLIYAAIGIVSGLLPLLMSSRVEAAGQAVAFGPFRPLAGLATLFALDSLGGGLVASAVIAYWLHVRFGADVQVLGPLFFLAGLLQSVSYEVSGRLGNRIGLVNTMVFTHLPSNILLLFVPFSPNITWAAGLLLARYALSQMDVPVRQAYVVSIVPPAERAGAVAMTGAARGIAQSFGPVLSGLAIAAASFGLPFFAAGGLKIVYDVALFKGFRNRSPAHEP